MFGTGSDVVYQRLCLTQVTFWRGMLHVGSELVLDTYRAESHLGQCRRLNSKSSLFFRCLQQGHSSTKVVCVGLQSIKAKSTLAKLFPV